MQFRFADSRTDILLTTMEVISELFVIEMIEIDVHD